MLVPGKPGYVPLVFEKLEHLSFLGLSFSRMRVPGDKFMGWLESHVTWLFSVRCQEKGERRGKRYVHKKLRKLFN